MVDRDVIAAKLSELAQHLARVRAKRPEDPAALDDDPDTRDLLTFRLMLAVQTCLDLASHIIADEAWPPATSLAGSFRRLSDEGVISAETASRLQGAAKFRNFVAHGYTSVDPERLFKAATEGPADLKRFAREVSAWLEARPSRGERD